jgi:hypothetical protein
MASVAVLAKNDWGTSCWVLSGIALLLQTKRPSPSLVGVSGFLFGFALGEQPARTKRACLITLKLPPRFTEGKKNN